MRVRELAVGDVLPPVPGREIMTGRGPRRWYALLVSPQREEASRLWLDRRWVFSFFPVEREVRFVMGRREERAKRFLPGYLFALFPSEPIWHRILDTPERPNPFIRDVIRLHSGEPARLHPKSIRALADMRAKAGELAERKLARKPLRKGGRAMIRDGALEGQVVEVVELRAGRARCEVMLLGGGVEVELAEDRLEAVEA